MRERMRCFGYHFLLVYSICAFAGCAKSRYQYGVGQSASYQTPAQSITRNPIASDGDHPRIDRLESIVNAPHRFLEMHFRFKKEDGNKKSPEQLQTEAIELSQEYLADNGLDDVYVDIRRYEPGEQWSRLRENQRVSPFWKYTGGTISVVGYSLFPLRAFHADHYNPFTNTLSLNSSRPTDALYEAGNAKEFLKHPRLGTYAIAQKLPIFPLGHHWRVTSDVLTYAQVKEEWAIEKELYPSAYAHLTTSTVSQAMYVIPINPGTPNYVIPLVHSALGGAGAATGHAAARRNAKQREQATAEASKTESEGDSLQK